MRRFPRLLLLAVVLAAACHIEKRVPPGSVQDEETIRTTVLDYYHALAGRDTVGLRAVLSDSVRVILEQDGRWRSVTGARAWVATVMRDEQLPETEPGRLDIRQEGDLASAWLAYRTGDAQEVMHALLQRDTGVWRIVSLSIAPAPPG